MLNLISVNNDEDLKNSFYLSVIDSKYYKVFKDCNVEITKEEFFEILNDIKINEPVNMWKELAKSGIQAKFDKLAKLHKKD